jgi:metal-responsive CopG/Arc/MetJ family transcriptional regulator
MASTTKTHATRINIALPELLLEEFKRLVPSRQRNKFIVDLVEREVRRLRWEQILAATAGAWSDQDHTVLQTDEDIERYVRRLRETALPRMWVEPNDRLSA